MRRAMAFVDFIALKQRLSIEQTAVSPGSNTKPAGSQLRAACPNCNESGERAIVITTEKGLFYYFAGKKGGDAIELVCHVSQKNANSLPRDSPPRFHCHLQKFSTILFLLWGNNHYKCKAEHL